MVGECRRIFVGNLPHEVTRDDIVSKFKKYGKVESVEIKSKKDLSSGEVLATFSYVNLNTDDNTLGSCIQFLNGIKWDGRHIKVEVAKESFLQRLQRERQSSIKPAPSQQPSVPSQPQRSLDNSVKPTGKEFKVLNKKNEPRHHSSSSESSDSEDEKEVFHPTSKLPMFKGIASVALNGSPTTKQPKLKNEGLSTSISKEIILSKRSSATKTRFQKPSSYHNASSEVLKKFESFSDVWKDSDSESDSKDLRFNSQSGRRNNIQAPPEKSGAFDRRERETQRQRFQNGIQNNPMQGSNILSTTSSNTAEEKRLKSLEARRQAFEQQKQAVKIALSDKGAPRVNKKIVFGDDPIGDERPAIVQKKQFNEFKDKEFEKKTNTLKLFEESDDESVTGDLDSEFQVKKQFEGKQGKKLLELQNRYNSDQRFKLDERFYDSEDEEKSKKTTKSDLNMGQPVESIEGLAEEREQQLQILSSVLGQPVGMSHSPAHHESKTKGMLRFDPLKPNHSRYELTREPQESKKKKRGKSNLLEEEEVEEEDNEDSTKPKVRREEKDPEPVSQSKFYSVSDTLAESLKQAKEGQGSGFSLLQMFGSHPVSSESKIQDEYKEMKNKTKGMKSHVVLDESSSEDEDGHTKGPTASVKNSTQQSAFRSANSTTKSVGGVWQESFFFQPNDSRLKEGTEFFSQVESSVDASTFAKKREALRHIVKLKLRKNTRKANSFNKKVSTMRKKAALWPSSHSSNVHKRRRKPRN